VDDRDAAQQTPLHHAADWNNIEVETLACIYSFMLIDKLKIE